MTEEQYREVLGKHYVTLFAQRDSIEDALAYAYSMNEPAATVAAHVVLNTAIHVMAQALAEGRDNVV
jgi:hypothetical protein